MKYEIIKQKWQGISLIISAFTVLMSSFFMNGEEFTITGGLLMILTVPFNVIGFSGLFNKFKSVLPHYANWGFALYLFGAVATISFGLRGVFGELFGISLSDLELATKQHPLVFTLAFFAIGPAYPISLLILGIQLFRKRLSAKWVALLFIIAGLSFPASRITRIPELMHLNDLVLVIPLVAMGINIFQQKQTSQKLTEF